MPRSSDAELLHAEVLPSCGTECCCLPEIGLTKPTELGHGGGALCAKQFDGLHYPYPGTVLSVSKVRGVDPLFSVLYRVAGESAVDPSRNQVVAFGQVVNDYTNGPALALHHRDPLRR